MYGSQVYVEKMGHLTIHERLRVITLFSCGHSVSSIRKRLAEENVSISLKSLYNLLKKYREKDTIVDLPHQRRRRIITDEMRAFIELEMANNDKLTSRRMKTLLCKKWPDLHVSISTIKRTRKDMGWVCTKPHYCQLIRNVSLFCCNQFEIVEHQLKYIYLEQFCVHFHTYSVS